jgi:hypothetical protein
MLRGGFFMLVISLVCSGVGNRFEVWPHDIGNSTDFGKLPELVCGRRTFAPSVSERFNGNVDADLIAVLEAVGDGFGRRVNFDVHAVDAMVFDAFAECRS